MKNIYKQASMPAPDFDCEVLTGNWPRKSPRYNSDWESNQLRLDVSQKSKTKKEILEIDLASIKINLKGGSGIYRSMCSLGDFQNFMDAIKIGINSLLFSSNKGCPRGAITAFLTNAICLFTFLLRSGVYTLAAVEKSQLEALLIKVINGGWFAALPYGDELKIVEELILNSAPHRDLFVGKNSRQGCTLKTEEIASFIGLPLNSRWPPISLSDAAAHASGKSHIRKSGGALKAGITARAAEAIVHTFNLLSQHSHGDSIPFLFADNITACIRPHFPDSGDTRSLNLPPDVAIEIITAACVGVLDLGPHVAELTMTARELLEKFGGQNTPQNRRKYQDALSSHVSALRDIYPDLVRSISPETSTPSDVLDRLVEYVFTSAVIIIAFSMALRAGETAGDKDTLQGLYYGCVEKNENLPDLQLIDLYITKTLQDNAKLWCGKLVSACIALLEEIAQASRPLGTPEIEPYSAAQESRKYKLFTLARYSIAGFARERTHYDFATAHRSFLRANGLKESALGHSQRAFRRLYAILYVYRFADPRIEALSQRFRHFSVDQTGWYFSDHANREYAETIDYLYKQQVSVEKEMALVRGEKLAAAIAAYFSGAKIGGGFPNILRQVMKELAEQLEFADVTAPDHTNAVSKELTARGYRLKEGRNGECMHGVTKKHDLEVNCSSNGVAHPEDASFENCTGCVMNMTDYNYISHFETELSDLEAKANDYNIPKAARLNAASRTLHLKEVIAANHRLCDRNKSNLEKFVASWKPIQGPKKKRRAA
jgi:hypothetical protein